MGLYLEDLHQVNPMAHVSVHNCQSCEKGEYSNEEAGENEDDCWDCPAGWYNEHLSNWKRAGDYAPNSDLREGDVYTHVNCTKCPVGQYNSEEGMSECEKCRVGTYLDETGANSMFDCKQCEKGRYSEETGNIKLRDCKQCPVGRFGNETGQTSMDRACHYCGAGEHVGSNETGKWVKSRRKGQKGCAPCGIGFFLSPKFRELNPKMFCLKCDGADEEGMQECHGCDMGMYGFISPDDSGDQHSCTECKYFRT